MKKLRYSAGMKAVVLVAHQCLVTVLVLCITMLLLLYSKNIFNFENKRNASYDETNYFTEQFKNEAENILDFANLRRKFEINGTYDADKEVDIWQYYENQEIPENTMPKAGQDTLSYRLGDLIEWSKSYNTQELEYMSEYRLEDDVIQQRLSILRNGESIFSEEKAIKSMEDFTPELCGQIIEQVEYNYGGSYSTSMSNEDGWAIVRNTEDVADTSEDSEDLAALEDEDVSYKTVQAEDAQEKIINKIVEGNLFELKENELKWLLQDLDMTYGAASTAYTCINEDYAPIDGTTIWEKFLQRNCSMEHMQNAYQALDFTLDSINEEISRYRKGVNRYNTDMTNIYYWVIPGKDRNIYTNIEDSNGLDLPAFGKKLGKYILYRESDSHLETNVRDVNEYFYDRIEPHYVTKGGVLFISVDTSFPYKDSFQEARQEYSKMYPWITICIWGAAASFLLELICLIYLSVVAGKRDDSGEVYLNFFDRIPTEILFLLASIEIIVFVYGIAVVWAHYDSGSYTSLMLLTGGVTFFGMAFLLVFYLSFIRRIRAGVLWMNSILRWFAHGISLLFSRQKSLTKMVLWFGAHLFACMCILPMIAVSYDGSTFSMGIALFALICGVEAVLIIREGAQRNKVIDGIHKIASGDLKYKISEKELKGDNKKLAQAVNTIGEGLHRAVDKSMKDERLQADLITNVSHDIKTPLTSIINYVDLLKREDLQNERAQNYIKVLDAKSQRLKQLAEDLVEASKISSGNINLEMVRLNLVELIHQTEGEFVERFEERGLTVVSSLPANTVIILADGRRIWRVLENLYQNVAKYAMEQTRVYVDLQADGEKVLLSIKNISKNPLNIAADELTERFIRGDISRSTEGSGLGLSIAQNLTTLMGGTFKIYLDGDLFKVMLEFQQEP